MKKENQRIAIAEAYGWSRFTMAPIRLRSGKDLLGSVSVLQGTPPRDKDKPEDDQALEAVPDYLNDLNAIRPVVLDLIRIGNKSSEYVLWLWEITGLQKRYGFIQTLAPSVLISELFVLANPTAEQMCEAYLKTIGKWTDD